MLIVGIDPNRPEVGPLAFARDLSAEFGPVHAIHVIGSETMALLRDGKLEVEAARARTRQAMLEAARAAGAADGIDEWAVHLGNAPERVLAELADESNAEMLVLGRRAPRDEDRLIRLGRVARRVLRALPRPVAVVPPDQGELASGPVIVALDGDDDSLGAFQFARNLAARIGRKLVACHISPMPEGWAAGYVDREVVERFLGELRTTAARNLERWMSEHGLEAVATIIDQGPVARRLARIAGEEDAAALVVGSRKLSDLARLFSTSIGTELAASARVPTIVVPAGWVATD